MTHWRRFLSKNNNEQKVKTDISRRGILRRRCIAQMRRGVLQTATRKVRWAWAGCTANPETAMYTLMGANLGVFCAWQGPAPLQRFMAKHFVISPQSINSGRLHTIATSAFSHSDTLHLASNMLALYFFGGRVAAVIGSGSRVIGLYLFGATAGSISHLYVAPALQRRKQRSLRLPRALQRNNGWNIVPYGASPALGASGAVNTFIATYAMLFPFETVYVNLILPVPAVLLATFAFARDLAATTDRSSTTSHSAHVGGALAGVAAFVLLRKRGALPRSPLFPRL